MLGNRILFVAADEEQVQVAVRVAVHVLRTAVCLVGTFDEFFHLVRFPYCASQDIPRELERKLELERTQG